MSGQYQALTVLLPGKQPVDLFSTRLLWPQSWSELFGEGNRWIRFQGVREVGWGGVTALFSLTLKEI